MIDPMANIDAAPAGPEMDAAGGDGNQEVFDMNAYRSNFRKMDKIRSFMGIASGCVAGICGLTGLAGLACFIILHITVNLSLLAFKMKFDLHSYSRESMFAFLTADLQKCAMSFMLFW
eukprot:CAMPEP_0172551142 /NCGR_PEP_ID=MMETSP1067-20121228/36647_1 /TAXON_ID=265564 ORGANISM="Thalassiosira punctigera, Strain Tpunct2005C2" /NCGR_SAMPLE_ID=MMETSP1067 /ASSEMBLY_ACC=CAM_ASM_000444 /LENGTH=117 /DNA_ID=CAMNT_0013338887 /DNA_START=86 /DNA_END=436 /DNA_ORIENTATION=-